MKKIFKTVDDKFNEIGFRKIEEGNCHAMYERYNEVYKYTQVLEIHSKASGRHIIQSYDRDLMDENLTGNICVGLTYYEMKLALKKMRKMGLKTKLPGNYKKD